MKKLSLLEKAKKVKVQTRYHQTDDEVEELSVAWARGEIGYTQVETALYGKKVRNGTGSGSYIVLAQGLRRHLRKQEQLPLKRNDPWVFNKETKRYEPPDYRTTAPEKMK